MCNRRRLRRSGCTGRMERIGQTDAIQTRAAYAFEVNVFFADAISMAIIVFYCYTMKMTKYEITRVKKYR